ncbi:carcinoembryonic antigen-related cell adhesion molecule 3-like [Anguilla rostrata]|uniref:carcinoembryonic antigen-related cell adhesion molecule 3-like n=1 Tax=Anguilla rostrata TaxID=7938 RepID=UPI0030D373C5
MKISLLFPVSRAEKSLFVRKGSSVRLGVQEYADLQFLSLSWRFNISTAILEYTYEEKYLKLFKSYENRAEFEKNFTLLLKNVQERDSGIYTAKITDIEGKDRVVASYRLTVQVSRAEESLFVRKGSSVRLDVQGYEGLRFNTLYWRFNSTAILEYIGFKHLTFIKFKDLTFYKDYKIRTEFDQKNFTLLLKNVQERDSGIYTAKITDIAGMDRDVASYRLTVQVSRAEESLFVRKGSSVCLDVRRDAEPPFSMFVWKFNITTFIHMYVGNAFTTFSDYKNKAEFDEKNLSLLLKNVQERDSGIYTARITDIEGKERDVASYRLIVQEAPPTPEVGVALLSSAGGFCKVSVNCSAKDTWASYTCDHDDCTQVANTTSPTGVNIIVTATNRTIHCSSSNRVDIKTRSESIKDFCAPVTPSPGLSLCALKSVLFSLGLVAMVSAVIAVNARERCCRDQSGLKDKSVRGEERINI